MTNTLSRPCAPSRRQLLAGFVLSACALYGVKASASEVQLDGYSFPDTATVGGQNLVLNGVAASSILSTRSSVVGFYLPSKQKTMETATAVKGPKRIQFYMVRNVSARDLSNALLDRIRQNVSREEFGANIIATAQLGTVFSTIPRISKGDKVVIDYLPATASTEFTLNGQKIGDTIQGEAFFPMMMKVWIGPKVRDTTRDGLLGLTEAP
ncbi:hypothetical protein DBR42_15650 [Pelomonas sp. HMWF004]|nr:hypothetical protein DBR42_15650 [Pelomonas sp. HMWF004]